MMSKSITCILLLGLTTCVVVDGQSSDANYPNAWWGPWTGWSVCSKTCGYGTAYRIRTCHKRHRDASTPCEGSPKQYRICLTKNCTDNSGEYRWRECSKHNTVYYGRQQYTWVPYINEASPCELSCKSLGYGYYARFGKTVIDGVVCNEKNTAICMEGKCITSGCDNILDSDTKLDRCGICGGDGNSCELIKGIFTRTHLTHRGYNIVTTIPVGARSINITEMSRSRNYLALSTPNGYFLNGEMRLRSTGTIDGAGTSFTYSRLAGIHCPGECLTAPGPLNTSLRVELIYFGRNPGIMYDYTLPRKSVSKNPASRIEPPDPTPHDIPYSDSGGGDAPNSPIDSGRGRRPSVGILPTPAPSSIRMSKQKGGSGVGDGKKYTRRRGGRRKLQNDRDSQKRKNRTLAYLNNARGLSSDQLRQTSKIARAPSEANRGQLFTRGDNSTIKYKHYYHTNDQENLDGIPVVPSSDDRRIIEAKTRKGGAIKNQSPSYLKANSRYDDRYAEFRSNEQYQRRAFASSSPTSAPFLNVVRNDNNVIPAPTRDRSTNSYYSKYSKQGRNRNTLSKGYRDDYRLYRWKISGFTQCTEECGGGLQDTQIVCVKSDSQVVVIEENCDPSKQPNPTTVVCNTEPCKPRWAVSDWTPCSVTCGRGLQKRTVECKQRISPTLTISVGAINCPPMRPPYRQYCEMEPCYKWSVSDWGECSTHCGFGQRTRTVTCKDAEGNEVSSRMCPRLRPKKEEICDKGSCAQGWFHTKWSKECSAECGRGFYTRHVYCSASDGSSLNEKKCGDSKPRDRKRCKAARPCGGKWFAGAWSACNATCGPYSERQRDVLCIKRHGKKINQVVKEHNCDPDSKPASKQSCGPFPECAPQWFIMPWSSCSKTCGTGVRTREVKCIDSNFTPSADCNKNKKPSRRRPCNTQPCEDESPYTVGSNEDLTTSLYSTVSASPQITTGSYNSSDAEGDNNYSNTSSGGVIQVSTATPQREELQQDDSHTQNNSRNKETKKPMLTNDTIDQNSDDPTACRDKNDSRWCQLAFQARLCRYNHYKEKCCKTCSYLKHNPH